MALRHGQLATQFQLADEAVDAGLFFRLIAIEC
jgi:hypothetical protein